MRVAIIGGRLQGVEAAYLAAEAGHQVVLIDRRPAPPAAGLAHEVHLLDIRREGERARALLASCDAVLPALEDGPTLEALAALTAGLEVPFCFDAAAYRVTSSKLESDRLLARLGVPRPLPWPECGLPAVVKPSGASGGKGVVVVDSAADLAAVRRRLEREGHQVVVQEHLSGPALSLEVVGTAAGATSYLPTGLEADSLHDCRRVTAPVAAEASVPAGLRRSSLQIAQALDLRGIMDVEAIVVDGQPRVIEIDARLPSQTPTVVYHCCGVNLVEETLRAWVEGSLSSPDLTPRQAVVYQHVRVRDGVAEVLGERVMAGCRPLRRRPGFHGADEALTDYEPGAARWAATLINCAPDLEQARARAGETVLRLAAAHGLRVAPELSPPGPGGIVQACVTTAPSSGPPARPTA